MGDNMTDSNNTKNSSNTQDDTPQEDNTPQNGKKGRVRRVSKKQQDTELTDNETADNGMANSATESVAEASDTDNTSVDKTSVDETVLHARVEQVATGILDSVLGQTGMVASNASSTNSTEAGANQKPVNRRELAAIKARQMRLNSARAFLQTGKLINAKQRLFDILESAPDSTEADMALEMLLELAAHYETIGQSRWALDLYDDIARYG